MASRVSGLLARARRLLSGPTTSSSTRRAATPPSVNHIALAVPSLAPAASFYRETLGLPVSAPESLPSHGVTVAFVKGGGTNIELLEPIDDTSPIANFLRKRPKGGMHHMCIDVDDLPAAMETLKERGVRTLAEPKIGAHGRLVVFLHPVDAFGALVELQQR